MKVTKKILIEYFKGTHCYDVNLAQLYEELNLSPEDLPFLEVFLEELVNEGWIVKSINEDKLYEYDPGKKLNFGGLRK
jgi:hypothetical protein